MIKSMIPVSEIEGFALDYVQYNSYEEFHHKGKKNRVLARGQSKVKNFIEMGKMYADRMIQYRGNSDEMLLLYYIIFFYVVF